MTNPEQREKIARAIAKSAISMHGGWHPLTEHADMEASGYSLPDRVDTSFFCHDPVNALALADAALAAIIALDPAPESAVAIWSGEHRAYWRKGADGSGAGYTVDLRMVGEWPRAEAIRLSGHCGPEKLIALHDRPEAATLARISVS